MAMIGTSRSGTVRLTRFGMARPGLADRVRGEGLTNGSEGLANRSEWLGAGLAQALLLKVKDLDGPGWPKRC